MHPKLLKKWFPEITSAILVLVLLYTAIMKLVAPGSFTSAMLHNPVIGPYAHILRWAIPLIEIFVVSMLMVPVWRRSGLLASTLLMAGFTVYIFFMLVTSSSLPCTCGGILQEMSWTQHLHFNSILTLLSLVSFFLYPNRSLATDRSSRTPVDIVGNHLTN